MFNVDLILAALLGTWFRRTGMALLVLSWAVDALRAVALTYHFNSPLDLLRSARYSDLIGIWQVISISMLLGLLLLALLGLLLYHILPAGRNSRSILMCSAILLCALDVANGSSQVLRIGPEQLRISVNIAGSPGGNTVHSLLDATRVGGQTLRALPHPVVYERIRTWQEEHPRQSVLLVLVESMGQPVSPELTAWMQEQLVTPAIAQRWSATRTVDAFSGSTTYGELRVLCGLYGHYSILPDAGGNRDCLPLRAHEAGMQAQGLHGFDYRMFDRYEWWPKLGLAPHSIDVSRAKVGETSVACNAAFPGVCDRLLLREAVRLAARPAQFVYALTLDTHLPLAPQGASVGEDLQKLCLRQAISDDSCLMVARLGAVLAGLRDELLTREATPLVVVVGDHSPPFVTATNRGAFLGDRVPVWILEPRR